MPEVEKQEVKVVQEKDLLSWTAPARPFKRRTRDFYVTVLAIAGLFGLILFFVDGFLPVILVISLVFLYYVMSTVEPDNIMYGVTNKGIKIAGSLTPWEQMGRFWFTRRFDNELLVLETSNLTGRMELVVTSDIKPSLQKALSKYLVHEEVPPNYMDKAATWFSKKLPNN